MATFKVNQRVRILDNLEANTSRDLAPPVTPGSEGTVLGSVIGTYVVMVDGTDSGYRGGLFAGGVYRFHPHELAPLAPPEVESWAADAVRKVTKPTFIDKEVVERERHPVRTAE